MREAPGRGRRQRRDEARLGEPANPVAEDTAREAAFGNDDACTPRRPYERRVHDLVEHEVAEGSTSVPAFEPLVRDDALRARPGVELERLEPGDAREAMAALPPGLRVLEVGEKHLDRALVEPELPEPRSSFVRRHAPSLRTTARWHRVTGVGVACG
jgi:hypothetical protein